MSLPIAIVLPDLGGGGAQKVMLTLAGGLDRQLFSPRIIVLGGSRRFAHEVPAGVPLDMGEAPRIRDGIPWLLRRLRESRPATVISVMGYLNLALLACKPLLPGATRLIVREANTAASTTDALPRWLPARGLYRALYPRADAIVCPSQPIAEELQSMAPSVRGLLAVIANPVDVDTLRRRALPIRRTPGVGLRLVAVGRLTRQKGLDRLVEILPLLPHDLHLDVLGDGAERPGLEARLAALGLSERVTFHGFTTYAASWIAGADALVLPSRWEGLPNVVLESLALGTPVVASDEANVAEVAARAVAGCVAITSVERGFQAAIRALGCNPPPRISPRTNLLPLAYGKEEIIARWQDLLINTTAAPSN